MKISEEILRQFVAAIDGVDEKFAVVELIDRFDLESSSAFEIIEQTCSLIYKFSGTRFLQVWYDDGVQRKEALSIPAHDLRWEKLDLGKISPRIDKTFIKGQTCYRTFKISSAQLPNIFVSLYDNYYGHKNSPLFAIETNKFIDFVFEKLEEKIATEFSRDASLRLEELSAAFLTKTSRLTSENSDAQIDSETDDGWGMILQEIANRCEISPPFNFPNYSPKWQILTVEKARKFLNLRAEISSISKNNVAVDNDEDRLSLFVSRRLEAELTVSGISLDREDQGKADEFLSFNPLKDEECYSRFASTMWEGYEYPESELVIPIRNARNRIVAIVNVEHKLPNIFAGFRARRALRAVTAIRPFVLNLIDSTKQAIDRKKELDYLLFRIVNRLSGQYQHRSKNEFATLLSSLQEMRTCIDAGDNEEALNELVISDRIAHTLRDTTLSFNERAKDFIRFSSKNLIEITEQVVTDSRAIAADSNDGVKILFDNENAFEPVFCSGLLSEHLYSILQNSIENFAEKRKAGHPVSKAYIKINCQKIDGERDNNEKLLSKGFMELILEDNGGGLPPEVRGKEFGWKVTSKPQGTGSGLPSARSYMRSFGGDVYVEDNPGVGIKIFVRVPIFDDKLHEGMAEELNLIVEEGNRPNIQTRSD